MMIRTFSLNEIITSSFKSSLEQGLVFELTIIIYNNDCVDSQIESRGEHRDAPYNFCHLRTLPWVVRCGQTRENCLPRMAKTPTEQTGYFEPLD